MLWSVCKRAVRVVLKLLCSADWSELSSTWHDFSVFSQRLYTARRACTAVMSVFVWEVVVHGVRCMLGSMGLLLSWQSSSWSVLCKKKKKKKVNWCTWGCSFALLHQSLVSFALHGRAVVTVGLNCYDHQKDVVISKVFFHQSGHSPKIIRAGLERTDSQTVGEFPSRRRKGRYTTLNCCASEYFSFCDLFTLYFILILCML